MNKICLRLFAIVAINGLFLFSPVLCHGQVAADSSHTNFKRDSLAQRNAIGDTTHVLHMQKTVNADSLAFALRPHPFQPNPKKAGLYSAILPGLGQAYNRQYWKIPVIYGGLAIAGYFINSNLKQYQAYRLGYISRINNPNYQDQYTKLNLSGADLQQLQNDYSKYLDLTVLFTGVGFLLQIVDAIVSAHLKNFDISRDISMQVSPVATQNGAGLGLVMNFK